MHYSGEWQEGEEGLTFSLILPDLLEGGQGAGFGALPPGSWLGSLLLLELWPRTLGCCCGWFGLSLTGS